MKRSVLLISLLFFAFAAFAQTYKQEVIASAGGYTEAAGIKISWTLGETIVPTMQDDPVHPTIYLTHGFQSQIIMTAIEENLETLVTVTLYPNPASDIINIKFEEAIDDDVDVVLINSQGKSVKTMVIGATTIETQVNLQDVNAGIYYLKLTKGKLSNVYKVVKL